VFLHPRCQCLFTCFVKFIVGESLLAHLAMASGLWPEIQLLTQKCTQRTSRRRLASFSIGQMLPYVALLLTRFSFADVKQNSVPRCECLPPDATGSPSTRRIHRCREGALLFTLSLALGCSQNAPVITPTTGAATTPADSNPILLPVKVSGKLGYVNSSGQMVINPQFDDARAFREGRASVCLGSPCSWWVSDEDKLENSHWGYIDASGKMVYTTLLVNDKHSTVENFSADPSHGIIGLRPCSCSLLELRLAIPLSRLLPRVNARESPSRREVRYN
jgi:hypothetical protein